MGPPAGAVVRRCTCRHREVRSAGSRISFKRIKFSSFAQRLASTNREMMETSAHWFQAVNNGNQFEGIQA